MRKILFGLLASMLVVSNAMAGGRASAAVTANPLSVAVNETSLVTWNVNNANPDASYGLGAIGPCYSASLPAGGLNGTFNWSTNWCPGNYRIVVQEVLDKQGNLHTRVVGEVDVTVTP